MLPAIPAFLRLTLLCLTACAAGCTTVRPYQRIYLNDESMQLGKRPIEKFDEETHTYREGSTGGGTGRGGGGCGCN